VHFPFNKRNLLLGGGAALWLIGIGFGSWVVSARNFAPGVSGHPEPVWPEQSALRRNPAGFTLVVALHPECPCSQATLEELDSIMAQNRGQLSVHVLCLQYDRLPEPVERSAIWRRAQRIPGVTLTKDMDGAEARRFAALTSGEARLYGANGALIFHGGITGSRGHMGDNPGSAAVLDFISGHATALTPTSTPAFGCSL